MLLAPSMAFSDVMGYLLPDVEIKDIMFDAADPSVAIVTVLEKDDNYRTHHLGLHVMLVDDDGKPIFSNLELAK